MLSSNFIVKINNYLRNGHSSPSQASKKKGFWKIRSGFLIMLIPIGHLDIKNYGKNSFEETCIQTILQQMKINSLKVPHLHNLQKWSLENG